ncbi:hypothetical protein DICA0_D18140 [Diutina catenulata]
MVSWSAVAIFLATTALAKTPLERANDLLAPLAEVPGQPVVDNVYTALPIPPWDNATSDYALIRPMSTDDRDDRDRTRKIVEERVLPLLQQSAEPRALRMRADIHMFGNYSVAANYSLALGLYHQLAISEHASDDDRGHAYLMLGFIHSSGVTGHPRDPPRAQLYYQMAADLNNIDAMMVVAYRHSQRKSTADLAVNYYTKLAEYGIRWWHGYQRPITIEEPLYYNIRLPDFAGGLYGKDVSEERVSIFAPREHHLHVRNQASEYHMDLEEHEYFHYYYDAADYLSGDYLVPRDVSRAIEVLQTCVAQGAATYGPRYQIASQMDKYYLPMCQTKLAELYMASWGPGPTITGLGAADAGSDTPEAGSGQGLASFATVEELLTRAHLIHEDMSRPLAQLGKLWQRGHGSTKPNIKKAADYYAKAVARGSKESLLRLALLLLDISTNQDPLKSPDSRRIYDLVKQASFNGSAPAIYYYCDMIQSGVAQAVDPQFVPVKAQTLSKYYQTMIDRMESFFYPGLPSAFAHYVRGNFQNALVLYALAAEQGSPNAQVSAAHLLYQRPSLAEKFQGQAPQSDCERVAMALRYLDMASEEVVDAMVMLGDIHHDGIPGCVPVDLAKAHHYYRKSFGLRSEQGAFKLGKMYEYGHAPSTNGSADYFMAHRYYDYAMEMIDVKNNYDLRKHRSITRNRLPISWALLRLRFKLMFSIGGPKPPSSQSQGWFDTLRRVRRKQAPTAPEPEVAGYEDDYANQGETYDTGDYLVIFITLLFFFFLFIQNMIRQVRRVRGGQVPPARAQPQAAQADGEAAQDQQGQNQEGWRVDLDGPVPNARFARGNFQFQFFAI